MTKSKKSVLISVLCVLLFASIALFSLNLARTKFADAKSYSLHAVNSSLEQEYLSHWKNGQNSYGHGESGTNGGTWSIGYGDVGNENGQSGSDVYSFTELTKQATTSDGDSARYTSDSPHQMTWGFNVTTKEYTYSKTQTMLVWTAKGYGHVSFNGLFSKATTAKNTLAVTQNGLDQESLWIPMNWGDGAFNWTDGDSYTVSISVVKPLGQGGTGNPSVVTIASATYTSEYVYLIPQDDIWVEAGDMVVFGLKCNSLAESHSDWSTNTLVLIDATFTQADLPGTYKQLYSVTGGTVYSSYNHYFSRSIVNGEGPFNWVESSNFLTGHTDTVHLKFPITTWDDSFVAYALWAEFPATSSDLVFTPKFYDKTVDVYRTITKGTMIHLFSESGAYSTVYCDDVTLNLGKNGFKGWIIFPIEFLRTNIVDPNDDFIIEFASGAASVNNIKIGSFGVFDDMAEFLYAYVPSAADAYYTSLINDYISQTNALTATTTFQTNKKSEIVSWLNGLKNGTSSQTSAQKIAWAKTLNEDFCDKYAEFQAQHVFEGDPINSIFVMSDTHYINNADGGTMMKTTLRDMQNLQSEKNVNAMAMLHLGDLSDHGLVAACTVESHNDLDDYYEFIKTNYLSDLSGNAVPYLNILGNHDVRGCTHDNLSNSSVYEAGKSYYTANDEILLKAKAAGNISDNGVNFSYQINGYTFIMLNTSEYQWDDCYLTENDLVWLENELNKVEDGKPCFVLVHQPVNLVHTARDASWTSPTGFRALINKFSNVIVLSGHTHQAFGSGQSKNDAGLTIDAIEYGSNGSVFINMPSLYYNWYKPYNTKYGDGICQYYYIEIYENGIVLKGRDFGMDRYIPESVIAFARTSTVEFKNYDGSTLSKTSYEWGSTPVAPSDPTRPATSSTSYYFKGWDKSISTVKGAQVYTATYSETPVQYKVTLNVTGGSADKTSVTVDYNGTATFKVTPNSGYEFSSVSSNATYSNGTVTVSNVTSATTVNVVFKIKQYTVTLNVTNGTSDKATATVDHNGTATFKVTPNSGYEFSSVSSNATYSNDGTVTVSNVTSATTVNVVFKIKQYTVTLNVTNGTSDKATATVDHKGTATFKVTPNDGYEFYSISSNATYSNDGTVTVSNVTSATTVDVVFKIKQHTVTISVIGGTANQTTATVDHNGTATFKVTPTSGYEFSSVSSNATYNNGTVTVTNVTSDITVTVTFVQSTVKPEPTVTHTVTINVIGGTADKTTVTVDHNGTATFTVTPTSGYEFSSVSSNATYNNGTVTVTNVTSDTTVTVTFVQSTVTPEPSVTHTVTISVIGGTADKTTVTVDNNGTATFTVTPTSGYEFSSVSSNATYNNGTVTVANVTSDTTVTVTFVQNSEPTETTFKVTVKNDFTKGTITGVTSKNYPDGEKIRVTITAKEGYVIKSVKFGSKSISISNPANTSFAETITSDVTITVTYEEDTTETSGGCGSSIGGASTIILSLLALVSASVLIYKKKEN